MEVSRSDGKPDRLRCVFLGISIKNWILFVNERAPPLVFLLLAMLPTASGLKLCEGLVDYEKLAWGTTAHLVSNGIVFIVHVVMEGYPNM